MSVENSNVIDFISTDKSGDIVMTISDHLEWDEHNQHLLILQDKLNKYLEFIESGQLEKNYRKLSNQQIIISLVLKHKPNNNGYIFLKQVKELLKASGCFFSFEILS